MNSSEVLITEFKDLISKNLFADALELVDKVANKYTKERLNLLEEFEKELELCSPNDGILRIQAYLNKWKGLILAWDTGKRKISITYQKKALAIAYQLNDKGLLTEFSLDCAFLYRVLGEFQKALSFMDKANHFVNDLPQDKKNKQLGRYCFYKGLIHTDRGRFKTSEEFVSQAIQYNPHYEFAYGPWLVRATNSYALGEYEKAHHRYVKAIKNADEGQKAASRFYHAAYNLDDSRYDLDARFHLLWFYLDQEKRDLAQEVLVEMKEIVKHEYYQNWEWVSIYLDIAHALILKQSSRLSDIGLSMKIFKEFLEDLLTQGSTPTDIYYIIQMVIVSYCELLLYELKLNQTPEIFDEIANYLQILHEFGERETSYRTLTQTLLLSAQLQMVKKDISKAEKFFERALKIANDHSWKMMKFKIEEIKKTFHTEFNSWMEIVGSNPELAHQIEKSNIEMYLEQAIKVLEKYS